MREMAGSQSVVRNKFMMFNEIKHEEAVCLMWSVWVEIRSEPQPSNIPLVEAAQPGFY